MINIGLADNIPMVHYGIKNYFKGNSKIRVTGFAFNYDELSTFLLIRNIDVLILDIELTDFSIVTDLKWVVEHFPKTKILIYSNLDEQIFGLNCIKFGAKGYLKKTASLKDIELAIKKINKGELVLSDCLKNSLLNKKNFEKILINKLSARESEVLVHLCAGKKNSEISDLLHINVKTTSTYKTRLFKKLEVTNLVSLVAKCKSLNII
jgi:DNA-binding NarL/FixJ family response regulator